LDTCLTDYYRRTHADNAAGSQCSRVDARHGESWWSVCVAPPPDSSWHRPWPRATAETYFHSYGYGEYDGPRAGCWPLARQQSPQCAGSLSNCPASWIAFSRHPSHSRSAFSTTLDWHSSDARGGLATWNRLFARHIVGLDARCCDSL